MRKIAIVTLFVLSLSQQQFYDLKIKMKPTANKKRKQMPRKGTNLFLKLYKNVFSVLFSFLENKDVFSFKDTNKFNEQIVMSVKTPETVLFANLCANTNKYNQYILNNLKKNEDGINQRFIPKNILEKCVLKICDGNPVIYNAAALENYEIVKTLIERGVDVTVNNNDAINSAAIGGHLDVVQLLIQNGASINHNTIENVAANGHLQIIKLFIQNDNTVITTAIRENNLEFAKYLIEICENPFISGTQPLLVAARNDHWKII